MTPTKTMNSKTNQESRCGPIGPGPHVSLKPVVGFRNHCLSKPRNPSYSIGLKVASKSRCIGPGPAKYALPGMKAGHMSIGVRTVIGNRFCTPGPYGIQELKCPKNPGFTMGIKTKPRVGTITPGPYELFVKDEKRGFTIGKSVSAKSTASPGPYDIKFSLVEQRAPAVIFSKSTYKQLALITPGPCYFPPYNPKPAYTFGIKHSPCSRPYFTEQEDKC